jgi:anti-anti-sigma regulatory factor
MPSELLVGNTADGLVIRLVGRGTMQESLAFRAAADSNGAGDVIFDAMQCDYLDSTFLGCLIGIKKACEQTPSRRFLIRACNATQVKLFSTSSLDKYFDFVETCPEPVGELKPIDIGALDRMTLGRHSMRCHEHLAERGGRDAAAFKSVADCLRKELDKDRPQQPPR